MLKCRYMWWLWLCQIAAETIILLSMSCCRHAGSSAGERSKKFGQDFEGRKLSKQGADHCKTTTDVKMNETSAAGQYHVKSEETCLYCSGHVLSLVKIK